MLRGHNKKLPTLTRRDFARGIAVTAATAAIPHKTSVRVHSADQEASARAPELSATGEAQLQSILAKYGKRFSDEQKADVRRLVAQAEKTSGALHAFPLENSDEPAMIFHIYQHS